MPVTRTAARALRKSKRREKHNAIVKNRIRYLIRKVKKGIEGKTSGKDLTKDFQELTKVLDKAAEKNIIHKNKAARLKSRFAQKINASQKPQVAQEKPAKKVKATSATKSRKKSKK